MRTSLRPAFVGLSLLGATLMLAGCHPGPLVVMDDVTGGEHPMAEFSKVRFQVRLVPGAPGATPTSHNPIDVYCTTVSGTATNGVDYVAMTDKHCGTIPAGAQSVFFNVKVVDDLIYEPVETFTVQLRVVGASVKDGSAIGYIGSNDAPPPA